MKSLNKNKETPKLRKHSPRRRRILRKKISSTTTAKGKNKRAQFYRQWVRWLTVAASFAEEKGMRRKKFEEK